MRDFGTNDYELYDLKKDIGETMDVIDEYPEIAGSMKTLMEQHLQSTKGEVVIQGIKIPVKVKKK